jgi:NarL family two-component system response regulator LiaR
MKEPIRVLITDDHAIVRKGLTVLLSTERDIKVVGEAKDGMEAVEKAGSLKPDVVLMDLVMPRMDGIEATRRITEAHSKVKILVLTSFAADDKVFPAVKAGALGYLLKDTGPEELLEAIHRVHRGEPSLRSPTSRVRCFRSFRAQARRDPPPIRSLNASWKSCASSPRGSATRRSPRRSSSPSGRSGPTSATS